MIFKNHYNGRNEDLFFKDHEINLKPSLTIPDQTMPIKTIMERYARGLPFSDVKTPMYYGDDLIVPQDFHKWDLADRQEYAEQRKQELNDLKNKFEQENKPKPKYEEQEIPFEAVQPAPPVKPDEKPKPE